MRAVLPMQFTVIAISFLFSTLGFADGNTKKLIQSEVQRVQKLSRINKKHVDLFNGEFEKLFPEKYKAYTKDLAALKSVRSPKELAKQIENIKKKYLPETSAVFKKTGQVWPKYKDSLKQVAKEGTTREHNYVSKDGHLTNGFDQILELISSWADRKSPQLEFSPRFTGVSSQEGSGTANQFGVFTTDLSTRDAAALTVTQPYANPFAADQDYVVVVRFSDQAYQMAGSLCGGVGSFTAVAFLEVIDADNGESICSVNKVIRRFDTVSIGCTNFLGSDTNAKEKWLECDVPASARGRNHTVKFGIVTSSYFAGVPLLTRVQTQTRHNVESIQIVAE